MSYIFDALQRSEAERNGGEPASLAGVTELLRRAEHRAASRWESAAPEEQAATGVAEREEPFDFDELPQTSQPAGPPATEQLEIAALPVEEPPVEEPSVEEPQDLPSQCRTLPVSLPPQSRLVCLTDSNGPGAESFRFLGVRLRHLRHNRPLKKVLITSTVPQEGKSMVAANLACALALTTTQRTVLLEGDVRRPSQSRAFGISRNPGLCEWLAGDGSLGERIYRLEGTNLWIMPAGSAPSNPLELLQSGRLAALMDELAAQFDWVIIDSPPVLPLADTSVWTRAADGILLVVRRGITEKRQLMRGLEALESGKLIGAVSNCSTSSTRGSYYYRPMSAPERNDSPAS